MGRTFIWSYLGQTAEFMAQASLRKGVDQVRGVQVVQESEELAEETAKFLRASDEFFGTLLTTYTESKEALGKTQKAIANESLDIARKVGSQDPDAYQSWIKAWTAWVKAKTKSLNTYTGNLAELNKILHNINQDPKVWENLEKTVQNIQEIHEKISNKNLDAAFEQDPRQIEQIERDLTKFKAEIRATATELNTIIEDSLKKIDLAAGNSEEEFVKHYRAFYQKVIEPYPGVFRKNYLIPPYQELPDTGRIIGSEAVRDPRLNQLASEIDELDRIWKLTPTDPENIGNFQAKKKSISTLLSEIIKDSPQTRISQDKLTSLIVSLEDTAIIPKRYSRVVSDVWDTTAVTTTKAVQEIDEAMNGILDGIAKLRKNLVSAREFFEEVSPKLRAIEESLTDPRLYG
ncbi:MAG: hypothetical protein HRU09_17305 [Oligoflexales bacterium]|nr:hypothetical protein [Oligoflexales bacterium]